MLPGPLIVVPHAGTWIEIEIVVVNTQCTTSFPTRERGLKYVLIESAPIITMSFPTRERGLKSYPVNENGGNFLSFPTRERGLKCKLCLECIGILVVPHAGTWIEISVPLRFLDAKISRSPRGNVD